jgi:hypothetical protein
LVRAQFSPLLFSVLDFFMESLFLSLTTRAGLASFRRYWAAVLARHVAGRPAGAVLGLRGIAEATGIEVADLVSTLQVYRAVKHWRTQYVVLPASLPAPREPLVAFGEPTVPRTPFS